MIILNLPAGLSGSQDIKTSISFYILIFFFYLSSFWFKKPILFMGIIKGDSLKGFNDLVIINH